MNFMNVIKEDFLGDQWQILMNDVFEAQRFWITALLGYQLQI